jgi:hypothetical protein
VGDAVRHKLRCAWGKFRELSPLLTLRGISLKLKRKLYSVCVQSVLVYGRETWALKFGDVQRMVSTERMMDRLVLRVLEGSKVIAGATRLYGYFWYS